MTKYLKDSLPYFALFLLGAFAASSFSPFAAISRQTGISSINDDKLSSAFPLAVGTTWEYRGWIRQQEGQEQDPERKNYSVKETVTQHDKSQNGNTWLITLNREETRGDAPAAASTVGYLTDGTKFYRIENEDGLNAVRKSLYGDNRQTGQIDRDMVAEISRTPTYDLVGDQKGCFHTQTKSLSSDYEETFCIGIGPTSMTFTHHGTIDEYSLQLVSMK